MRGSAAFRTGVAPGGALAPGWVKNELWRKARTVPSLDLRFAENKSLVDATTGASLVTFTRASSGTFVGSDGVLRSAVTNIRTFSNAILAANLYGANNATLTTVTVATPISSTTASLFTLNIGANTGNNIDGFNYGSGITLTNSTQHSYSLFVKPAGATVLRLRSNTGGALFNFTLTGNGTAPSPTGDLQAASIVSFSDGWYRVSWTFTSTTSAPGNRGDYWTIKTNVADGTNGLYVVGAQLEQASTAGEYIPTTSVINSAPRFDHSPTTGESLGLLVEEARTNVLLNSATLSTQSVTVAAAANTLSFYGTGTVTLTGVSTAGPLVGTGVNNRVSLTFTPTVGVLVLTVSGSVTNAQLEAGAFPTSYIPTTTAAATRSADVASITGTAFSSWYRQDEGTVFAETQLQSIAARNASGFDINDNSTNNRIVFRALTASVTDQAVIRSASSTAFTAANVLPAPTTASRKSAVGYKVNDFMFTAIGSAGYTGTTGAVPVSVNQMLIGYEQGPTGQLGGTIKRLTYWPTRLPDNTLQSITQ